MIILNLCSLSALIANTGKELVLLLKKSAMLKCGDPELEVWYNELDDKVPALYAHNPCDFDGIFFSGIDIWGMLYML